MKLSIYCDLLLVRIGRVATLYTFSSPVDVANARGVQQYSKKYQERSRKSCLFRSVLAETSPRSDYYPARLPMRGDFASKE